MTTAKIERVKADIARTKGKILDYQSRLRELERQKTELENTEIISMFRGENLSEDEFAALLQTFRRTPSEALAAARDTEKEIFNDDEN